MAPASYAMFWWIGDGTRRAGRIEVGDDHLDLASTSPTDEVARIGFADVARVLLERGLLHLERRGHTTVHIGSLDTPGALRELANRVSDAAREDAV
jgi:hypothetical protein